MEIAGLALGVYPALMLAFEQYKKGAKYCQNWMRFRRRYHEFIHDTGGQQLFFEAILQDLMCNGPKPFLTGINSKDDFLRVVRKKSYTGWRDPVLEIALTSRLGDKYSWCMCQIELIYEIMTKLEDLVDVQALEEKDKTVDWWKLQWERLKQALSEERYKDLKNAAERISQLKEMIASCDVPQWWMESNSKLAPFFTKVRDNANNMHIILKNGWHCSCSNAHKAMLQLERRVDDRESEFCVMFAVPSAPALESSQTTTPEVYIHKETRIAIVTIEVGRERENLTEDCSAPSQCGSVSGSASPDNLKHHPSQLSTSLGFKSDDDGQEKDKWPVFQAWKTRMKSFRTKQRPRHRTSAKSDSRDVKAQKAIESVHRQFVISIGGGAKDGIVAGLETMSISGVVSSLPTTAHTNFPIQPGNSDPISDLCDFIHQPVGFKPGYLVDPRNKEHHIFPEQRAYPVPRELNTVTLKALLEGDPHAFPPSKRAVVAAILASSLLQLQRTHWLKDDWCKKDIFFMVSNDAQKSVIYERPYISQDFISKRPLSAPDTTGEMEELPKFQLRTALQCLAILLIELCFGEPIEHWKERLRLQPIDMDDQARRQYSLAIAHTWTEEEIYAHEPGFSDPVSSCLNFPDVGREKRGQADQVIEDIYTLIVKPLYDMTTNRWPNSFSDAVRCW